MAINTTNETLMWSRGAVFAPGAIIPDALALACGIPLEADASPVVEASVPTDDSSPLGEDVPVVLLPSDAEGSAGVDADAQKKSKK